MIRLSCLLAVALVAAQATNEYTLQRVYDDVNHWGLQATEFSNYRWNLSRKDLDSRLVGAPIRLDNFPVDATKVTFGTRPGSAESKYSSYIVVFGADVDFTKSGLRQAPSATVRLTSEYTTLASGNGGVPFRVRLADNSDRLARELTGTEPINGTGKILTVGFVTMLQKAGEMPSPVVSVEIQLTNWRRLRARGPAALDILPPGLFFGR